MPALRSGSGATPRASRKKAAGPSDPCPICNARVGRQSDLKRHIDQHASYDEKKYRCSTSGCTYRTNILCAYNAHVDKHDGVLYPCPSADCDREFTDKATRSRHYTKFHKAATNKKKARTSQTVDTVHKFRVPATVRREIKQEVNETYSLFSHFSSGAQLATSDAPVERRNLSGSDGESDSTLSTLSTPPASTPVNLDVGYMFNDQYLWPGTSSEGNFDPTTRDSSCDWMMKSYKPVPADFLDKDDSKLALVDSHDKYFQNSELPRSLQDISCDAEFVTDPMYHDLIQLINAGLFSTDATYNQAAPVPSSDVSALYSPIQPATSTSGVSLNTSNFFCADPSDPSKTWTQTLEDLADDQFRFLEFF